MKREKIRLTRIGPGNINLPAYHAYYDFLDDDNNLLGRACLLSDTITAAEKKKLIDKYTNVSFKSNEIHTYLVIDLR